jgi:hypothetical protein
LLTGDKEFSSGFPELPGNRIITIAVTSKGWFKHRSRGALVAIRHAEKTANTNENRDFRATIWRSLRDSATGKRMPESDYQSMIPGDERESVCAEIVLNQRTVAG